MDNGSPQTPCNSPNLDYFNLRPHSPKSLERKMKLMPNCEICSKRCEIVFARLYFSNTVESYCSKQCWDKVP